MKPSVDNSTALDKAFHWERSRANKPYLTQPLGGGAVRTWTWAQALDEARRVASFLQSQPFPAGSQIAIVAKNAAHWILADLAIWMAGHVSVPIYPTLHGDAVRYILEHSESRLLFVGKLDDWKQVRTGIPEAFPVVRLPLADADRGTPWEDIIGASAPLQTPARRRPEELATIIYTSGSTGVPKGVMLSFGAMALAAEGMGKQVSTSAADRMLSYLPLAHGFERWAVETCSLTFGFQVFFAESLDTFLVDLRRARPTLFVSVPRLWRKFQLGVLAKLPEARLQRLLGIPVVSSLLRRKILRGLGLQHVRFAGSGSAPIPPEVIAWYRRLGLELLEGYGMTENFAYSHMSLPGRSRVGYVGNAYPEVAVRIGADGEILVRSPASMMGYFKAAESTAEAFTEDGYLRTGDQGELDEQGRLRLTGRVKELFKTSKGKYVAPAPIENLLLVHADIEQACVMGSGCPQPFGLVALAEQARASAADPAGRRALGGRLEEHLRTVNEAPEHHERLDFVAVTGEEWRIDNGLLTPTLKIKRSAIEARYGEVAQRGREAGGAVVWLDAGS
ncbi:MAG: AMP-binding protein [Candidatus Schekmanbacteria bacterium]|nr:AMP-binding protein [Candidatus Schekmanbacteria bacterium]